MTYTTAEVLSIAGITPRQLQWWNQQGVTKPESGSLGRGHSAQYNQDQVTRIMILKELINKGLTFSSVGRNIPPVIKANDAYLAVDSAGKVAVFTDKKALIDCMVMRPDSFTVIDIQDVHSRIPAVSVPKF